MALQKDMTIGSSTLTQCNIKVEYVEVWKDTINVTVVWRAGAGGPPVKNNSYTCSYDIAGDNPIKQAYEHLKTLPEFAGAADV